MGKLNPTYHVELLKKYIPNDDKKFPGRKDTEPGPLPDLKDEDLYEVDKILAKRNRHMTGEIQYKIKWKGWSHKHNSWVPADQVASDLVQEFNQRTAGSVPTNRTSTKRKQPIRAKRQLKSTSYVE